MLESTSSSVTLASTILKDASTESIERTQTQKNELEQANLSISNLSNRAKVLSSEITTLLEKIKTASADESVTLYKQMQSKSDLLTTLLSSATAQTTIAQNSLKSIYLSLSNTLSEKSIKIKKDFEYVNNLTKDSTQIAAKMLANASTKAYSDAQNAKNEVDNANLIINNSSGQINVLSSEIATLLGKIQVANSVESISLYQQMKEKSDALAEILDKTYSAFNKEQISLNAVQNVNIYSSKITLDSRYSTVGSEVFTVSEGDTKLTIATYAYANDGYSNSSKDSAGIDPELVLLKWNENSQQFQIVGTANDDGWTPSDNYRNSIISLTLDKGIYKIAVADYPFNTSEAIKGTNNKTDDGIVTLYFTSSSDLIFENAQNIEKYSYITRLNNIAYINNSLKNIIDEDILSNIEEGNAKFGILADSAIGTSVQIDDYGYFVTISDSYLYKNDCTDCTNVFIETDTNKEVDDGSSWGYWTDNISSIDYTTGWVSGNRVTPADDYKNTFTGQVIGSVSNGSNLGYIKLDNNNLFKATIDIGSASITNSAIKFNDSLNGTWNGTFNTSGSPNVNTSGFSSNIVNNSNNITGSLSGSYFGIDHQVKSIGGTFFMINGLSIANGVFKARSN